MLLNITTTHQPATDLEYLLHKHPDKCQSFPMTFGQAHVFCPESTAARCTATLNHTVRLQDLLSHLYVLIPMLDDDKHYWVGDEEIDKLLRHGEGWLNTHLIKEQITQRYLKRRWSLKRSALAQLTVEDSPDIDSPFAHLTNHPRK